MDFAALIVSLLALSISGATYVRSSPGVKVRGGTAGIFGGEQPLGTSLTVTVRSSRSASLTIEYWGFEIRRRWGWPRRHGRIVRHVGPYSVPRRSGPEYPHRLDPGDPSAVWGMAVKDLVAFVKPEDRLRAYVLISTRARPVRDRPWRLLKVEDFSLFEEVQR